MALIIKSNARCENALGTLRSINTSPEAEYLAYKSRVEADGGVVQDEVRTSSAFRQMFDLRLYGRFVYFAAAFAGVKKDSAGGILKVYSLDGEDMVGGTDNGGDLPKISSNGFFDFSSNRPTDNGKGGYLRVDTEVFNRGDTFAQLINIPAKGEDLGPRSCVLSAHATYGYSTDPVKKPIYEIRQSKHLTASFLGYTSNEPTLSLEGEVNYALNKNSVFWIKHDSTAPRSTYFRAATVVQDDTDTALAERFLDTPATFLIGAGFYRNGKNYGNTPVLYAAALRQVSRSSAEELSITAF